MNTEPQKPQFESLAGTPASVDWSEELEAPDSSPTIVEPQIIPIAHGEVEVIVGEYIREHYHSAMKFRVWDLSTNLMSVQLELGGALYTAFQKDAGDNWEIDEVVGPLTSVILPEIFRQIFWPDRPRE